MILYNETKKGIRGIIKIIEDTFKTTEGFIKRLLSTEKLFILFSYWKEWWKLNY